MAIYDPNDTVTIDHPELGPLVLPTPVAAAAGVPAAWVRRYGDSTVDGVSLDPPPPPPPPPPGAGTFPAQRNTFGGTADNVPIGGVTSPSGVEEPKKAPPKKRLELGAPGFEETARAPLYQTPNGPRAVPPDTARALGLTPITEPSWSDAIAPTPVAPTATAADQITGAADTAAAALRAAAPKPLTDAQLVKEGHAGVLNQEDTAIDQAKQAGVAQAKLQSALLDAQGNAHAAEMGRLDQIAADRAKAAQAYHEAYTQKAADIDAAIGQYTSQKIDRSLDHPVLSAIGVALGAIGQGLIRGDKNPAIDALNQSIDRKVQAQLADRQALGQAIGFKNQQLNTMRQSFQDQNAFQDALTAAEIQRTQQMITMLAEKSGSQQVVANAQKLNAELDLRKADLRGQALDKDMAEQARQQALAEQRREHNQSIAMQGAHLKLAQDQFEFQKKQFAIQELDKLDQKSIAQLQEIQQHGVFDPTSGHGVLTPEGQQAMAQADAIEAAARATTDPQKQTAMRQQAQQMRDRAEALQTFTIKNDKQREDAMKAVSFGQGLVDVTQKIKDQLAADPGMTDRQTWARIEENFEQAKGDWIKMTGANVSSREFQAVEEMFGAVHGTGLIGAAKVRTFDKGVVAARLDEIQKNAIAHVTNELHTNGYKGTWMPRPPENKSAALSGDTSAEAFAGAEHGALGKLTSSINPLYDPNADTKAENAAIADEVKATGTLSGLGAQNAAIVNALIAKTKSASDRDYNDAVKQLSLYAQADRTAGGTLSLLRSDPELYKAVLARLPAEKREAATQFDRPNQNVLSAEEGKKLLQANRETEELNRYNAEQLRKRNEEIEKRRKGAR